jgi:hypothetical protein
MQIDNNNNIELKKLTPNGLHNPTEMEDCLDSKFLFNAINKVIEIGGSNEQKEVLKNFEFNEKIKVSRIKGENSIFLPKNIEALNNKQVIYDIFEDNRLKYQICNVYVDICNNDREDNIPSLFKLIEEYFNK